MFNTTNNFAHALDNGVFCSLGPFGSMGAVVRTGMSAILLGILIILPIPLGEQDSGLVLVSR